ncbi:MAG: preprotein translocase subunit SecG [Rickettsiales bacterium]|nr:MAG: preprotein translocase subunit SecG [Rickettsiales bacterium]
MLNTLLFIHLIIALLLIIVILLQKTSTDGLSGIGGGGNMGLMSGVSAASFLMKTTIVLGVCFFVNALILANLSSKSQVSIIEKMQEMEQNQEDAAEDTSVPMAK